MIRILHVADIHLGVENHGRLNPETGLHTRLEDFCRCLDHVIDVALEEGVDAVLFAGDAYKTIDPTPTQQRELARRMRRLDGIPIVMVPGNHDAPVAHGKASSVDIFGSLGDGMVTVAPIPAIVKVITGGGILQVACLPWLHRSRLLARPEYQGLSQAEAQETLTRLGADTLERLAAQIDPQHPAVLLAHLAAADATYGGSERTAVIGSDPVFQTRTLANQAFCYVALGHIHKHQDLNPGKQPPVVYPGSIERVDFGEEFSQPGACIVEITGEPGTWQADYRHVASPARPMTTIRTKVEGVMDPTATILDDIRFSALAGAIVRVIYEAPSGAPVDLSSVHAALEAKGTHYVADIKPAPTVQARTRRAGISESVNTLEALKTYLANRDDLNGLAEAMLLRHAALEAQAEEVRV